MGRRPSMANASRGARPCQVCTLLARPLEAFMGTIALVAILSSIAWSLAAGLAALPPSISLVRTANSGCTHLMPRTSRFQRSSFSDFVMSLGVARVNCAHGAFLPVESHLQRHMPRRLLDTSCSDVV